MNLNEKTQDNLTFMIKKMMEKLQIVNREAIQPDKFALDDYDDIKDLYEMVQSKSQISVSEMQAIIAELGQLRKS